MIVIIIIIIIIENGPAVVIIENGLAVAPIEHCPAVALPSYPPLSLHLSPLLQVCIRGVRPLGGSSELASAGSLLRKDLMAETPQSSYVTLLGVRQGCPLSICLRT